MGCVYPVSYRFTRRATGMLMDSLSESIEPRHFSSQQIAFFEENGYLSGPRVLSDDQIDVLKNRIDDLITGRVDFPQHL